MIAAQLQSAASALLRRSTTEQGLPEQVTDPGTLTKVAALLAPERGSAPASSPGHCQGPSADGHEEVSRVQA